MAIVRKNIYYFSLEIPEEDEEEEDL